MLVFQWNALRVGDQLMVHDDLDSGLVLWAGIVRGVEPRRQAENSVTIRLDGPASRLVQPRRHAVHMLPLDTRWCWRCGVIADESANHTGRQSAA